LEHIAELLNANGGIHPLEQLSGQNGNLSASGQRLRICAGSRTKGSVRWKGQGEKRGLPGNHVLFGDGHSGIPAEYLRQE
jgi:hypothetical protein